MDDPPGIEIVVILALILLNGFFSLSEMAIVSARKSLLKVKADAGKKSYQQALNASENPSRFLSTIQIGITLIGTLSGAFGGATLAGPLSELLSRTAWLAPYADALAVGIVVLAITFLSIVLGELVPKQIALANPEAVSASVVPTLGAISMVFRPLVSIFSWTTSGFLKLFGVSGKTQATITEEEIHIALKEGERFGIVAQNERSMMEGIFYLGDKQVETFMTHRSELHFIEADSSEAELLALVEHGDGRSWYPVVRGGPDNVIGVVSLYRLLLAFNRKERLNLRALSIKPTFVPSTMSALKAVELFRKTGVELLLVIDEYGGLSGSLSLRDLVEEIVGDLFHSTGTEEEIIRREDGSWLIDGLVNIDEVSELLGVERLIPEHHEYHTLAGFILDRLGEIPHTGDYFEWERFRIEIVDMDGNRIDKVLITPPIPSAEKAEE